MYRRFKIIDDDNSRTIDRNEFKKCLDELGLETADANSVFDQFDKDGSGSIDFDEFLVNLRVRQLMNVVGQ